MSNASPPSPADPSRKQRRMRRTIAAAAFAALGVAGVVAGPLSGTSHAGSQTQTVATTTVAEKSVTVGVSGSGQQLSFGVTWG